MELFHYAHCPFCVRVRMALGFLNKDYRSIVLDYDDEDTPISLTGKKMLPILKPEGHKPMNESLDIIKYLDTHDQLKIQEYLIQQESIDDLLNMIGKEVHNMAMPYWIWTPEFNETSRAYFQKKKEAKRGPFKNLIPRREEFINNLEPHLKIIESSLQPFYKSSQMTFSDIAIAAHLWGMYVVPEFQFSPKIHDYLQSIKSLTHFNYQQDFWK